MQTSDELEEAIQSYTGKGWRVVAETQTTAQLLKAGFASGTSRLYLFPDMQGALRSSQTHQKALAANFIIIGTAGLIALTILGAVIGLASGYLRLA